MSVGISAALPAHRRARRRLADPCHCSGSLSRDSTSAPLSQRIKDPQILQCTMFSNSHHSSRLSATATRQYTDPRRGTDHGFRDGLHNAPCGVDSGGESQAPIRERLLLRRRCRASWDPSDPGKTLTLPRVKEEMAGTGSMTYACTQGCGLSQRHP